MKIGDTVKSIHTHPDAVGIVVAIMVSELYIQVLCPPNITPDLFPWTKQFPNWRNEHICIVYFATPILPCPYNSWINQGLAKGYTLEKCIEDYKNLQSQTSIAFPIEDLNVVSS